MHSAGALQSASSKNRVGEQVTCNVWQLQLSRLSVSVCVLGVCVCVCVSLGCIASSSSSSSWAANQVATRAGQPASASLACLPATHIRACHMQHTHTLAAAVCGVWNVLQVDDACSSCVKWAPLGARRIWGWVQCLALFIPAPCTPCVLCASLCCGMKVKFYYTARTAAEAEWQWQSQWHRPSQKPKSQWSLPLPWPWPWPVCGMHSDTQHTHTHISHSHAHRILTQLLVVAGNAVTHTDTCTHTHTLTHNALDYGAYA